MTSCPMRDSGSIFTPQNPHFFTIILQDNDAIPGKKLFIPKRFARKYGSGISNTVKVKVPSGDAWELEWSKSDGNTVWFKNGWQEFSDYYSISFGYFLVFEYVGNSEFSVLIFDKSTTEIDYPVKSTPNVGNDQDADLKQPKREEETKSDGYSPKGKKRRKSGKQTLAYKKKRTNPSTTPDNFIDPANKFKGVGQLKEPKSEEETEVKGDDGVGCSSSRQKPWKKGRVARKRGPIIGQEKAEALRRVTYKSENPFFKLVIQPSYLNSDNKRMNVPMSFSKYFPQREGDVTLCIADGKSWDACYHYDKPASKLKLRRLVQFYKDNALKVGDICVFELINDTKITFKIFIFRDVANGGSHKSRGKCKEEIQENDGTMIKKSPPILTVRRPLESAKRFCSKNPFFTIVMRPSYRSRVYLPSSFVEKYMKRVKEKVTLQVECRSWHVEFCKSLQRFCIGWTAFRENNALQEGDVCIFELIEKRKFVLKVHIFRGYN